MSDIDAIANELTDPELISRVREGDVDAYGTLFSRHVDAATRLARLLVGGPDADDLVSEAFVKVLNVLLGGGGPDVAFRAYLLTAVRRLHVDKMRGQQRLTTTGDMTPYDPGVPFADPAIAGFEGGAAAKAFASLPERWQMVLWHLEVENQKPADIAPLLGMSANSVSALAYRAREGLRQAFLNMHSGDLLSDACRDTNDLMGAYVRQGLSRRDTAKVEDHLDECRRCTAVYLELAEVNSSLAGLLGPALLGGMAAAYLGGGAVGAAGAGAGAGALAFVGRMRDVALGNLPATAATVTAVGVAGVTAIAVINRGPNQEPATAERPSVAGVSPSSTPSSSSSPATRRRSDSGTTTQRRTTTIPTPALGATGAGALDESAGTSVENAGDTQEDPGGQDGQGAPGGQTGNGPGAGPGPTKPSGGTDPDGGPKPTKPADPTTPGNPDPSETPTPSPGPPSTNVGVHASVYFDARGHLRARVQVTGVPPDQQVRLQATAKGGDLHSLSGNACSRAGGNSYRCIATPGRSQFVFATHSQSGAILGFSVSPPTGWTDPDTGNNSTSVSGPRQGNTG